MVPTNESAIFVVAFLCLFSLILGFTAHLYIFPFATKVSGKLERAWREIAEKRRKQKNAEKLWKMLLGHSLNRIGFHPIAGICDGKTSLMVSQYQGELDEVLSRLACEFSGWCETQKAFSNVVPKHYHNHPKVIKKRLEIEKNLQKAKDMFWVTVNTAQNAGFEIRIDSAGEIKLAYYTFGYEDSINDMAKYRVQGWEGNADGGGPIVHMLGNA